MTEACPFCGREGGEMLGSGDDRFCRACADLIDVPAALKHLPEVPEENSARLGRYEIVREISRGKGGSVYEARDPSLDRRVALKVLDTERIGGQPLRRFLREGRLLARVRHPNVVQIHELGRDGGKTFIAMEFVDGSPFPGSADRDEAIRRLTQVARALDHVHRQGVVHRDLKPSNILVEKGGRPVVMDFGIARSEDSSATSVTATGAVLGTPGYMAPEQLTGNIREIDARTDVYALGVLLFEVLTGQLPITGTTVPEYLERLQKGPPPGPRSIRRDVPRSLDQLCRRAISNRREDRPASAEEFARALVEARSARSIPWRSFVLPLGAAAAVAVLAGSLVVWAARSGKETPVVEGKASPPAAPVAAWIEEAGSRKSRALGGGLTFEAAMAEIPAIEALYRRAIDADPGNAPAILGLARLYADLGRESDAHREFDRVLAIDRGNLEALKGKGSLVVTSQLAVLLDHKSFPAVSKAIAERIAEQQGRAFDGVLAQPSLPGSAASLARMYRAVARSEFDEARRLLSRLPAAEQPPFLDYTLQALVEQTRPAGGSTRVDEEATTVRGEPLLWLTIIRHLDRRLPRLRMATLQPPGQKTRVNAIQLRLESWVWEGREDRAKAAEFLGHATVAAPEYLQARLLRARLLKELGRREHAARELEAAGKVAASLNLGEAALREIRSLS
jgi:tetratricopeptide (TPR) repeat protein/predicted Ser/Thr protein kinase